MSTQNFTDQLYADPLGRVEGFSFDENVVRVFPDMLRRSIPGYNTIIAQSGLLAEYYAAADSRLYDLGCSLGVTAFAMRERLGIGNGPKNVRILAVDNSPAMVGECRSILRNHPSEIPIDVICKNITDVVITDASVVALNFTLQFVAVEQRLALIRNIYRGLMPGGVLILSEKIRFSDHSQQNLHSRMHEAFKLANGYSELEISQKRMALENILISDTLPEHLNRLKKAGFSSSEVWFQCYNFASIIALK